MNCGHYASINFKRSTFTVAFLLFYFKEAKHTCSDIFWQRWTSAATWSIYCMLLVGSNVACSLAAAHSKMLMCPDAWWSANHSLSERTFNSQRSGLLAEATLISLFQFFSTHPDHNNNDFWSLFLDEKRVLCSPQAYWIQYCLGMYMLITYIRWEENVEIYIIFVRQLTVWNTFFFYGIYLSIANTILWH